MEYPLVQLITYILAISPALSPWENCALKLIEGNSPSSIFFICKTNLHCPVNDFYKVLKAPANTIVGLKAHELPFIQRSALVFVIDDSIISWNDEAVVKYRLGGRNDFKLVIVANRTEYSRDFKSMDSLFAALWLSGIVQCAVLLVDNASVQLYTYVPFKNSTSCEDTTPVLLGECFQGLSTVFDLTYKISNINQCPIRIAIATSEPFFEYPLRGRMSPLIREVLISMNASFVATMPKSGNTGGVCGPEEQTGIRGMVYNGTTHMALANFIQRDCSVLEYVGMGYTQCLSWCTPVLSTRSFVYLFLLKQYQQEVWLGLLISVFVVSLGVVVLSAALHESWTAGEVLNLALTIYATRPSPILRTTPTRVVIIIWLWACLTLRAAYEGEMKSQSAVQLDSHIITGAEELVDSDLKLCSSLAGLQLLNASNNPIIHHLYKKAKVCNGSLSRNIKIGARRKDLAVLTTDLHCSATASELGKHEVAPYPSTGGCFSYLQVTPIVTLRGSPFKRRWRILQNRCVQAGLIRKWLDLRLPAKSSRHARPFSIIHILPALFIFTVGCIGGILFFVGEKIYYTLNRSSDLPY